VLTDEWIAGQPQGPEVERGFDVPRRRREEGIGSGLVQDRVAVTAPERREAGIEVRLDDVGGARRIVETHLVNALGRLAPDAFLPAAERTALMTMRSRWRSPSRVIRRPPS